MGIIKHTPINIILIVTLFQLTTATKSHADTYVKGNLSGHIRSGH